uniref:Uncharacterized protein n=1 Tax=Sander lucioperca TaxID=283035 RepID=A0A8C9ZA18_SANLU
MAEVGFRRNPTAKGRLTRRETDAGDGGRATITCGTKRHTRDAIPARPGESPVLLDPSTPPTNLPTRIFVSSYYSLPFPNIFCYVSPSHSPCSGVSASHSPCSGVSPSHSPCSGVSPSHSPCSGVSLSHSPCSGVSPSHSPCSGVSASHSPCSDVSPSHSPCSDVSPLSFPLL